jgi:hypothetical protein
MDDLMRVSNTDVLEALKPAAEELADLRTAEITTITDADNYRKAGDLLARVKMLIKGIETTRTELKAPALAEGKTIDSAFKPVIEELEKFRRKVEGGMSAYALEQERIKAEKIRAAREAEVKRLEEEKKKALETAIQSEQQAANAQGEDIVKNQAIQAMAMTAAENIEADQQALANKKINSAVTVLGGNGITTASKEWVFEIEKPLLVPRQYCEPVEKLIRAAVKSGVRSIDGVRIFEKARFTSR